jgi:peptidoglycan hydrolase CwlO-like protein
VGDTIPLIQEINTKNNKMKKTLFIAIMMIFTMSATTTFARNNDLKSNAPAATENKLSTEEVNRLNNRVEEIRHMDKSEMTNSEKKELREESKSIKKNVRKNGEVIYIGGTTLLIIILIIILV